jgi:hypothetical protein
VRLADEGAPERAGGVEVGGRERHRIERRGAAADQNVDERIREPEGRVAASEDDDLVCRGDAGGAERQNNPETEREQACESWVVMMRKHECTSSL